MDLKEIAAVAGKSGLFKILKPTRTGVILESLDESKNKLVVNSNTKVSILKDISIFILSSTENKPLSEVLKDAHNKYGTELPVHPKSTDQELRAFFSSVVPDYDTQRVYISDIKKFVTWYTILVTKMPTVFKSLTEEINAEASKSVDGSLDNAQNEAQSEIKSEIKSKATKAGASKSTTEAKSSKKKKTE